MKTYHCLVLAAATWSTAIALTVVATVRPQIALVTAMWAVMSLSVAVVTTVALLLDKAQYELTDDLRACIPGASERNGVKMTTLHRR